MGDQGKEEVKEKLLISIVISTKLVYGLEKKVPTLSLNKEFFDVPLSSAV